MLRVWDEGKHFKCNQTHLRINSSFKKNIHQPTNLNRELPKEKEICTSAKDALPQSACFVAEIM